MEFRCGCNGRQIFPHEGGGRNKWRGIYQIIQAIGQALACYCRRFSLLIVVWVYVSLPLQSLRPHLDGQTHLVDGGGCLALNWQSAACLLPPRILTSYWDARPLYAQLTGLAIGGLLTLPWNISLQRLNDIIILAPIVARLFKTNRMHIIVLIFCVE